MIDLKSVVTQVKQGDYPSDWRVYHGHGCKSPHADGGTHIIILWMSYLTLLVANAWDENNCTSSAISMWGFTPGGPSS